jgi:hypothetical protein
VQPLVGGKPAGPGTVQHSHAGATVPDTTEVVVVDPSQLADDSVRLVCVQAVLGTLIFIALREGITDHAGGSLVGHRQQTLFRLESPFVPNVPHVEEDSCVRVVPYLDPTTYLSSGVSLPPSNKSFTSVRSCLRRRWGPCVVWVGPVLPWMP